MAEFKFEDPYPHIPQYGVVVKPMDNGRLGVFQKRHKAEPYGLSHWRLERLLGSEDFATVDEARERYDFVRQQVEVLIWEPPMPTGKENNG